MASVVKPSGEPRYCPLTSFPEEEKAVAIKCLRGNQPQFPGERYDPAEVPRRVILASRHKAVPDLVAVEARLGL